MFFLEQFQGQLGATILFSKVTQTRVVSRWCFPKYLVIFWAPLDHFLKDGGGTLAHQVVIFTSHFDQFLFLEFSYFGSMKNLYSLFQSFMSDLSVLKNIETLIHLFFLSDKIQVSSWGCKICYKSVITLAPTQGNSA